MELKGKKVLVAGLGKTGLALVSLLMEHGAQVLVSDTRERSGLEEQGKAFQGKGLHFFHLFIVRGYEFDSLLGEDANGLLILFADILFQ